MAPENKTLEKPTDNELTGNDYERMLDVTSHYLSEQIHSYRLKEARRLLMKLEELDIARVISHLTPSERIIAFRILPQDTAVEVFSKFDPREQEDFLNNFTLKEVKDIVENMDPDDRTELFEDLPSILVKRLLKLLSPDERSVANQLLNYKEDSAGRIMTTDYVDLQEGMTAAQSLRYIKQEAPYKETIYTCYVVDNNRRLTGVVSLRKIILADDDTPIIELMQSDPIHVSTSTDQQEVIQVIKKYDFLAVPVTDNLERLVGIVTVDDVLDALEEENTEDFQLIAGIQPTDEGYLKSNFFKLIFNRSFWIVILLFLESFSQDIIKINSTGISPKWYTPLSLFFTIIVGVGGNIGSQSSVLVIRGLATGEITRKDTLKLLWRSLSMGIMMGAIMGLFLLARIWIFGSGKEVEWAVTIALTAIVAVSNFLGALLPILIKRIGIDPALISSPLITTLVDVGGLALYFEIAKWVLIKMAVQ